VNAKLYEGMAREMLSQLERLREFTHHNPSIGEHHEQILRESLRPMLSGRHSLRTGFAYCPDGFVSKQGDILFVDEHYPAPYLFRLGDLVVVQPEALKRVIEVKTILDKRAFREGLTNLQSFKKAATARNSYVATFLFAFDSPKLTPGLLGRWYRDVGLRDEQLEYPLLVVSLAQGAFEFLPEKGRRPYGHYPIEESGSPKAKSLSVFIQTVRKWLEIPGGIHTNPYQFAELEGFTMQHLCYRYGSDNPRSVPSLETDGRAAQPGDAVDDASRRC